MQPWSIRKVVKLMMAVVVRRPFGVTLVVGILPAIWMIPATIAQAALIPEDAPVFGPGRSLQEMIVSYVGSAWSCVWFAGQLSAAIDLVQDRAIRWRAFITGLAKAPALLLTGIVVLLPLDLLAFLPSSQDSIASLAAEMVGGAVALYLLSRTALWAPLVVDSRESLRRSFIVSWTATRGHSLKLIALGLVLGSVALPIFVIEAALSVEHFHVTVSALGTLYVLALAQLYSLASFGAGHGWVSDAVRTNNDLRESGTGWSRPAPTPAPTVQDT
jgi:hypothetical protein